MARRAANVCVGSLVADRRGLTTTYALMNLQDRGALFVGPVVEVYEGIIIRQNLRSEDMDVNPTKHRKRQHRVFFNGRGAGPPDPTQAPFARAGARVHPGGRVRRGHPGQRPAAQGTARAGCAEGHREPPQYRHTRSHSKAARSRAITRAG